MKLSIEQVVESSVIELPEYWDGLVDPDSITVTLTQIGHSQDLIVEAIEGCKTIFLKRRYNIKDLTLTNPDYIENTNKMGVHIKKTRNNIFIT